MIFILETNNIKMKESSYLKSPYLSAPKTKHDSFFPKIHKGDFHDSKREYMKSTGKQNYFKNEKIIAITKTPREKIEKEKPLGFKPSDTEIE